MTTSDIATKQQQQNKLERLFSFTSSGPIADTPSYQTTIPAKRLIQAGVVQETKITKDTKTTSTRIEQLSSLMKVLESTGALK